MPLQENTPARWESALADLTAAGYQSVSFAGDVELSMKLSQSARA